MDAEPTVFIVDDESVVRDSLTVLMDTEGLKTETFESAQEFLDSYDSDKPGCLLLDVRMPEIDGLELQERLKERGVEIPIVFLTAHADIPLAVAAMRAGAAEFIEKPFDGRDLLTRVRGAIDRDASQRRRQTESGEITARLESLSVREREVLELMLQGESTKRIAWKLGTSSNTVRNQRSSIFTKLQADSVVDVVRMVTELRSV